MHRAKEAFKAPCQATSHNKMACMDTKGTESMEPSDEFFFVAAGHHFKINSFIIAANKKKILISAVLMTMQLIKFTHSNF